MLVGLLDEMRVLHDFVAGMGETRTVPVLVDQTTGAEYTITAPSLEGSETHLEQLVIAKARSLRKQYMGIGLC